MCSETSGKSWSSIEMLGSASVCPQLVSCVEADQDTRYFASGELQAMPAANKVKTMMHDGQWEPTLIILPHA